MLDTPERARTALASRYRLERELGRGGMATVYLAQDLKHGRPVALKLFHPELASREGAERFHREVAIAARLSHPHILTLFDSGDADGLLYYVMPFVSGESLRARLVRDGPLPVDVAVRIGADVAAALAYAHGQGFVHRDIKPENVMLHEGQAMVADFGIAKALDPGGSGSAITRTGFIVGTPAYMSPEQAAGDVVDGRSDVYSLASVVFEMLAGTPPFGADAVGSLSRRFSEAPPSVRARRDDAPEALDRVLRAALAREAAARVGAAEFARALRAALESGTPAVSTPPAESPGTGAGSIVVLPFANLSPDPDTEYFSDGMTDELINALARVEGLRVVSRTTAFAFKGRALDVRAIGAELKVRAALEGSVRKAGRRLRVSAQLTDLTTGYQLWSEVYDRDVEDVFAIQEEISRAIVSALRVRLLGPDATRLVRPATDDLEAYTFYLKGRQLWNRRTEEALRLGLRHFERALERDPNYAEAHFGLADSYCLLGFYTALPPVEAFPRARDAALRALELDPKLTEARPTLAYVSMYHDWNWAEAERQFLAAIRASPGYATGHQWYGNFLAVMGRGEESQAEFGKAVALDPLSPIKCAALGWGHYFGRRFDAAIAQCERALELDPALSVTHLWMGLALGQIGRGAEAVSSYEEAVRLSPGEPLAVAFLAHGLALAGRTGAARRLLQELEALRARRYVSAYDLAVIHAGLGDIAGAVAQLERGYEERTHWMALLGVDPRLDPLRSNGRFERLLDALRLR